MFPLEEFNRHLMTIIDLIELKKKNEKIAALTAYDFSFSTIMDSVGIDLILVGDSLGNVIQGNRDTISVTVQNIAYHTRAVANGRKRSFLLADMPFASYYNKTIAIYNASILMQAGAQMIKMEGDRYLAKTISHLVRNGIPVCAHLGLLPQFVHVLGGFKVQGKSQKVFKKILEDANILEEAGAQLLILEAIPSELGSMITQSVSIPTIGIGAGPDCSGQILVSYDLLGIFPGKIPKFAKNFLIGQHSIEAAFQIYIQEVKNKIFPSSEHCFI